MTVVDIDGKKYSKEIIPFGEVRHGDLLESPEGLVEVDQVFDEHLPERMFAIETESGEKIEVSGNHLLYVETSLDVASHRLRCRNGRAWVKSLSKDVIEVLEDWARDETEVEIMLLDFSEELNAEPGTDGAWILARIAESIGPVSEYNFHLNDLGDRSEVGLRPIGAIPAYDRALMSQQVLSFLRGRKFPWKTIVGKVLEAKDLVDMKCEYWIPDVKY